MKSFLLTLAALVTLSLRLQAQAGPPFRTDDPETPGNGHWEINVGFLGDRSPSDGDYQVPDLDLNYGWGDRIQLKYELPAAIHENRTNASLPATAGSSGAPSTEYERKETVGGLGESLLGIKWRFYQHIPAGAENGGEAEPNFSVSTYPQLSLNNPTNAVRRQVVAPGPQFLLPLEMNARLGPLRGDGAVGYWVTHRQVPQAWTRGRVVGDAFSASTELYLELADEQDSNRVDGLPKAREATLGLGGRQALNKQKNLILLFMGGRSFQSTSVNSTQPSWLSYIGMQFLLAPKGGREPAE